MRRPCRRGLKLGDRAPDPHPYNLPVVVTAVDHHFGALGRDNLGLGAMLTYQQIGGAPDIEVRDGAEHGGSLAQGHDTAENCVVSRFEVGVRLTYARERRRRAYRHRGRWNRRFSISIHEWV